jgi:Fe-S-cluster-containing hydrogenase component 2
MANEVIIRSAKNRVYDLLVNAEKCSGCYTCQYRCSLRLTMMSAPAETAIIIDRSANQVGSVISFTEKCDVCTICALFCPYGALERVKKETVAS